LTDTDFAPKIASWETDQGIRRRLLRKADWGGTIEARECRWAASKSAPPCSEWCSLWVGWRGKPRL